ncbi:MAG: cupin domain-containing protein [Planctomycetota bacterium]
METRNFKIVNLSELNPVDCPCGTARRAFTDDLDSVASVHVVDIKEDAETHYHKKTTEFYYVLAGRGQIELDGTKFDIEPGFSIMIKPGCRHRTIGNLKILNIPVPAFDPSDEFID